MNDGSDKMQEQTYTIKDYYFWKIAISLGLASFFIFAALYSTQPLLPLFAKQFQVSTSEASLMLSVSIVGLIIGLILLGFLSDRHGRTQFIKLSLIGSTLPFFIIPIIDDFVVILIIRFIQGFMIAGLPAASLAYISEEIEQKSIGVATGLYISSNAIGGMLGRVMSGFITDHYSWQMSFYILGIIGVIVFILVLFFLPQSRFFQPSLESIRTDLEGFYFHFKNRYLLLIFGLGVVLQFSFTGMWTYLPFYLQEPPFSLPIKTISSLFLAYSFGVVGSPIAGSLAAHFGLSRVRSIGIIALSIGVLMTLSGSFLIIIAGLCLACLGFFIAHTLSAASVGEEATHHKGSASSLYLVAYYIGVTLGSTLLAPVWDTAHWKGVIIVTGFIPVAYLMVVLIVRRRRQQKQMS